MKLWQKLILAVFVLWLCVVGVVYYLMRRPPDEFAKNIARLPRPAMMLFPFQTMWNSARAGSLKPGDPAPDFNLPSVDGSRNVKLSSFLGSRPVVLVFGSYT